MTGGQANREKEGERIHRGVGGDSVPDVETKSDGGWNARSRDPRDPCVRSVAMNGSGSRIHGPCPAQMSCRWIVFGPRTRPRREASKSRGEAVTLLLFTLCHFSLPFPPFSPIFYSFLFIFLHHPPRRARCGEFWFDLEIDSWLAIFMEGVKEQVELIFHTFISYTLIIIYIYIYLEKIELIFRAGHKDLISIRSLLVPFWSFQHIVIANRINLER